MTWSFSYFFAEEDGMTTDPADYEAEITEEEYDFIREAVAAERPLKEERRLQKLQWRVYDEIKAMLVADMEKAGDEYTLLCLNNHADPFDYAYTLHVDIFDPAQNEFDEPGSYFL